MALTAKRVEEVKASLRTIIQSDTAGDKIAYLYSRWEDEKEYEDWAEYEEVLRKLTPVWAKFVKGLKRPFGFRLDYGDIQADITMKADGWFGFKAKAK